MMIDVATFGLKALIILISILAVMLVGAMLASRATHHSELEIEPLHKKRKDVALFLKSFILGKNEMKAEKKKAKAAEKAEDNEPTEKKVYVLKFEGDLHAHAVESLREEITAVLQIATPKDEVVLKLESPGGVVHGYGLAASQLQRIRDRQIPLTICVDKVAASGGYMMACVGTRILAAPFAIVGSIGVLAQVPNFHKVLKKFDVDYKEYTAGEYKRTLSLLGEIQPEGEKHFIERLSDTHQLFKSFVQKNRPQLDIAKVATGDHWYGEEALKLGLIDQITTSDDYLMSFSEQTPVFSVKYEVKQTLQEKLSGVLGRSLEKSLEKLWSKIQKSSYF